jgi:hypothetical protein
MCNYCGDNRHEIENCGVRNCDSLRAIGFFVDFPDEFESKRIAGERRLKEFSERTGVTIEQLLADFQASFDTTFFSKQ